jgi:anti-sigma factor RsiW
MRCVDCLPLIEEYFDGEVEERTAEQMAAHLSTCADCSAALDALSFEQEMYARYDRGGLEVTPALWARVSAEIAREPLPQNRVEDRPFLSRVRASVAAALSTLTARPALASSFALLLVGITAGSLWLAYVRRELPPTVAVNTPTSNGTHVTLPQSVNADDKSSKARASETPVEIEPEATPREGGREVAAASPREKRTPPPKLENYLSDEELNRILATQSASAQDAELVNIKYDEREPRPEDSPSHVPIEDGGVAVVKTSAQLLDPEEKEMARHVEQAQMLLRSIKNARAEGGDTVNVAYEKQLSRKLLGNNATLQLDAETRGDRETKQVLDRIEPYLLDIANMHDNASREEVRSIRERIDRKEIIAALQVY